MAQQREPAPVDRGAATPESDEPTVRISWSRVAAELPVEAFNVSLDQVAERMRQPGALLIPQSLVLPQLAEGLIRVGWDVIAPQFPHEAMAVSDAEMAERLPNGLRLPLDEIVRQVPLDLFMAAGPAADVRGLEYFPAPFQPLVSDPAPEAPVEAAVPEPEPENVVAEESREPVLEAAPALALPTEPEPIVAEDPVVDRRAGSGRGASGPEVEPDRPLDLDTRVVLDEPSPVVAAPSPAITPASAPPPPPAFSWPKPSPARAAVDLGRSGAGRAGPRRGRPGARGGGGGPAHRRAAGADRVLRRERPGGRGRHRLCDGLAHGGA